MRSYPVKKNPIDSAVSEILRYKKTDRQIDIVLLCIKDMNVANERKLRDFNNVDTSQFFLIKKSVPCCLRFIIIQIFVTK